MKFFQRINAFLNNFIKNQQGVTAIEYAIVAAGVAAVVLVIFNSDGGPVFYMLSGVFDGLKTKLTGIIQ